MNEKKLWKFLADLWNKALPFAGSLSKPAHHVEPVPGDVTVRGHEPCFGVCQCLVRMIDNHKVANDVYDSANHRLHEYLSDNFWSGGYLYDLDAQGAKQRAVLCRMMANQCD